MEETVNSLLDGLEESVIILDGKTGDVCFAN